MEIVKKYFSDFTEQQENQLASLKDLYTQWNEKINVISRKDMDNFYLHHVLHSLTIATKFNFKKDMQVMDLGCGGGGTGRSPSSSRAVLGTCGCIRAGSRSVQRRTGRRSRVPNAGRCGHHPSEVGCQC